MKKTAYLATALFFALATTLTASKPDNYRYKKAIEKGNAKEVKTDIDFLAGELYLDNSSNELAECFYGKGTEFLRPGMAYNEMGKTGYLRIDSESNKERRIEDFDDNEWRLSINPNIPNSVSIRLKAGEADIDLEGSRLNRFEYKMMAGESKINLRNTSVPDLTFNMMAGEAWIDLSGRWNNDLEAIIKGGVGELDLVVPYNVGVRIFVSGLIGEVSIPFFNRNGKTYTNDAYGRSKHTLFINIEAGIGEINVKMVE
ncbi:MAG: cell wall-active antibiotics response protein [Bacteroidales bacterium]|jgi:hypothetical protein|nr:cell wall-active antibiotics response protein [Bacteroidales bacterium]